MTRLHADPKCPHCKGSGVREIQSSGDAETGFDREWDDCDCRYEQATDARLCNVCKHEPATHLWVTEDGRSLEICDPCLDGFSAARQATGTRPSERVLADLIEGEMWQTITTYLPHAANDMGLAMAITQTAERIAREIGGRE